MQFRIGQFGEAGSNTRYLASGIFWSVIGSFFSRGLNFIILIIVARLLGSDLYGQYGIVKNTILMFSTFAGFGLGITATKFIAEYISINRQKAFNIASLSILVAIFLGGIIAITVFCMSGYLSNDILHSPWLKSDIQLASIMLFATSYNGAQIGILNGLGKFKEVAYINTFAIIISTPFYLILTYYFQVSGAVISFLINNILICGISSYYIRISKKKEDIKFNYIKCWDEWRIIYRYSLPITLSGLLVLPIKWIADVLTINSTGYNSIGIFSAALAINMIIIAIANTINSPFLTILSKTKNSNDNYINTLNLYLPWAIGLIVGLPLIAFPEIFIYLFGKGFTSVDLSRTVIIVLLYTILLMYKQGLSRIFQVYNLQWVGFISNLIWAICLISSVYILRDKGSVGLAISYLIAYTISTLIMYPIYIVRKWVPVSFFISFSTVAIWAITFVVFLCSMFNLTITTRGVCLLCSIVALYIIFKNKIYAGQNYK